MRQTHSYQWPLARIALASALAATLLWAGAASQAQQKQKPAAAPQAKPWDTYSDTWVATDALGRALPTEAQVGPPKANKTICLFYFLSHNGGAGPIWNIPKILAANPTNPQYGPLHAGHFWSEPELGYYQTADPSVIRKHMAMLSDAGVDTIVFDATNSNAFLDNFTALCKVLELIRKTGQKTPQVAFFASAKTASPLFAGIYSKGLYSDLWFRWDGKPLLMVTPGVKETLSAQMTQFFTIRESWAWSAKGHADQRRGAWFGDGHNEWTWFDYTPQNYGWHDDPNKPEQISVTTAQLATNSIGRSYHNGKEPPVDQYHQTPDMGKGLYFAEQWKRALQVDPELIFVTQWNEWDSSRFDSRPPKILGGLPLAKGGSYFVDEFTPEFSRDIEPMKGGFGDNYYMQMVANIRRYKGVRALPAITPKPIKIDGQFGDWAKVHPEFRDTLDDPTHRDFGRPGTLHQTNQTGRNDIAAAKVSYDAKNIYFYARAAQKLTPATGKNWMLLFIDSDKNPKTGWLGYDYVVNREIGAKTTTIERNIGGKYQWKPVEQIPYRTAGDALELAIPRALLGVKKLPATLDFKWADNIQQTGDVSDFTLNGDAAPNDRFNYRAKL